MNISHCTSCCGCGLCAAICPSDAIHMQKDQHGFLIPVVSSERCINCSRCIQICSFQPYDFSPSIVQKAYAAKNRDEKRRLQSRSGGVFPLLCEHILAEGGTVYGCALENFSEAKHKRIELTDEIIQLQGSKYIQSDIQSCFRQITCDLQENRTVLFSGTPCQVAAVKKYCASVPKGNLLTVDIICHGIPSPMVWQAYLKEISKGETDRIQSVDFRDKETFGWAAHMETISFKDGTQFHGCAFRELFYSHLIIRDCCFICPYKNINRVGDLTLGDCWGIEKNAPDFDDNRGVSLVFTNTIRGIKLFQDIIPGLDFIEADVKDYLQPPLYMNWTKPVDYDMFWNDYLTTKFSTVLDRYVYKPQKKKKQEEQKQQYKKIIRRIGSRFKRAVLSLRTNSHKDTR